MYQIIYIIYIYILEYIYIERMQFAIRAGPKPQGREGVRRLNHAANGPEPAQRCGGDAMQALSRIHPAKERPPPPPTTPDTGHRSRHCRPCPDAPTARLLFTAFA